MASVTKVKHMKTAISGAMAERLTGRPRDTTRPVLLVGFLDQGNLGLGYLASCLRACGYRVLIADVESPPEALCRLARKERPVLIGFSLIFQFYIRRYGRLVALLRETGIRCHLTMGGHFPSLNPEGTLREIPQLDSVTCFEGEETLIELVDALSLGRDWHEVPGLAWQSGAQGRESAEISGSPPRHLLRDLDDLPWPAREFAPETVLGHAAMPILASRGCARTCSFCSIHTFYRTAPGKVVRIRAPERIVEEMAWLHAERGIRIFLFQDDDFPIFGRVWRRWTRRFLAALHGAGLPGKIIWKINCRADAVEPELLREMQAAGLYLVYMGLESGDAEGLEILEKGISVAQNLQAVRVLRQLGLVFEFGFMMFDPSSSFASIRRNLAFLREVCADGQVAAVFCRMLPYDGTPIRDILHAEGRLKGDICDPTYDFPDPRIDRLYRHLDDYLDRSGWIHGHSALSPAINWAWNEVAIMRAFSPDLPGLAEYVRALSCLSSRANAGIFDLVDQLADHHEHGRPVALSPDAFANMAARLGARLLVLRNAFIRRNQNGLLRIVTTAPRQPPRAEQAAVMPTP